MYIPLEDAERNIQTGLRFIFIHTPYISVKVSKVKKLFIYFIYFQLHFVKRVFPYIYMGNYTAILK